ncbi:MAG: S-layer glycoprotein N-glycosyltransferase AglJ [Methanolinea sp.]|jgi:dolichol-phosphate mannosyltransferase|nr:S-layer glycoprotein N-glycosyltransferase AglJ [Methanolinea sp.]
MPIDRDQVCVLIPTLNESPTIGSLIREFRQLGYTQIFVIDGNSTDDTRTIATREGARVEVQSRKGKGNALIEAFSVIKQPYILMIDGDGTYLPQDAEKMLAPLDQGYDHVIGDRLTEQNRDSFSRLNFFGNQVLNRLFKVAHSAYLSDILSGYRAFRMEAMQQMQLKEVGFGIETEISAEAVRSGQKISIVPVSYRKRPGTPTKLNPFHDGFKITSTIYRLARMNNPLFYFGLIGLIIMLGGVLTGIYVILEWLVQVEHLPLTILTVLLIVVGFQIFMFGILSDMMLALHREVIREMHDSRDHRNSR